MIEIEQLNSKFNKNCNAKNPDFEKLVLISYSC